MKSILHTKLYYKHYQSWFTQKINKSDLGRTPLYSGLGLNYAAIWGAWDQGVCFQGNQIPLNWWAQFNWDQWKVVENCLQ